MAILLGMKYMHLDWRSYTKTWIDVSLRNKGIYDKLKLYKFAYRIIREKQAIHTFSLNVLT